MPQALIVDDNSENRYLLECILSANGFEVVSASNGREALDQADKQTPDLVLSDILMPVMDGFSLCRTWKQTPRLSSVPFVFYTATYTETKDEAFALSLGADLFIVKPTEPVELVSMVTRLLEQRSQGKLQARTPAVLEETPYLRQYNEALIRKLEDKLLQVEQTNQRLMIKEFAIASSSAGIAMTDLSGRIGYVNAAFVRLWCKTNDGLLGQSLSLLFSDPHQHASVMDQVRQSRSWSGELTGVGQGGRFIAFTEIHTVLDAQAAPLCLMIRCTDITERERVRQDLQRAQRMESLSQFAAGIAHDINNLLTVIFAHLNLGDEEPAIVRPIDKAAIVRAFERAREMTRRLLSFGKGTMAPRDVISVKQLVEESCRMSLSGSATELSLEFEESIHNVLANATELSEVFGNVVLNARQAMSDKGRLCVAAANRSVEVDSSGDMRPGKYVVIEFQDNGPGIDSALQQRIFEPFFTSKREGSGLGLAMSRAIIESYGGRIRLVSAPGSGARFQVWLPATEQAAASQRPQPAEVSTRGRGRILVLDDEELICRLTAHHLERLGYEVTTANVGEEVIALDEKTRAEGRPFDLFILDLGIVHGMGGSEAFARLRANEPNVVALACSGQTDDATAEEVKAQGFVGILGKPFLAHELASMVKAAIATRCNG